MQNALFCAVIAAAYLGLFYIWGRTYLTVLNAHADVSSSILFGFILMTSAFQVIYLPFLLARGSFRTLTYVWLIILALITGEMIFYISRKTARVQRKRTSKGRIIGMLFLAGLTLFLCLEIAYHARPYGADTNFYIDEINNMVYDDVISISGSRLDIHHGVTNIFALFGISSLITGIRPYYIALHTMRYVGVILTAFTAYNAGKTLGTNQEKGISWMGIGTCFLTVLFFSSWSSLYGGAFFWQRTNEAKAYCQLVLFPIAFIVIIQMFQNREERKVLWKKQMLVGFSAIPIAVSSLSAYPFFMLIGMVALIVYDRFKNVKETIGYSVLCVLPNLIYLVLYFVSRNWSAF